MKVNGYEIKPKANLSGTDLFGADLSRANLFWADLSGANLSGTDLFGADLSRADLTGANLTGANLSGADLSGANLFRANLSGADLSGANLSEANLSGADLFGANLSGAIGLKNQSNWLKENFKTTKNGIIVYKDVMSTFYNKPKNWKFKQNQYLEEVANHNRTNECGCGINFATLDWCKKKSKNEIWECLIEWIDLAGICVPYNTDGKARCERLKLIRKI